MQASDIPSRVNHPGEIQAMLEALTLPGGASMIFEAPGSEPLPAVLMDVTKNEPLLVDITAVSEIAAAIDEGERVQLIGQSNGAMLRTPPLQNIEWQEGDGRLRFTCAYPEHLELLQRRSAFRAELKPGMKVAAHLFMPRSSTWVDGALINLSLGGCLLELPLSAAVALQPDDPIQTLILKFPNNQRLEVSATLRHVKGNDRLMANSRKKRARIGCEFQNVDPETERRLWTYVRYIESASVRYEAQGERPSSLFEPRPAGTSTATSRPHGADYATPMARRLAQVTAYLNNQLLALQQGEQVVAIDLSRYSDQVLDLLEEDREALLFATVCTVDDHPLAQHGVSVAVRLADLATVHGLPRHVRKAIIASAMVHDLGKALLPEELRRAVELGPEQKARFNEHIDLIEDRLVDCRWLSIKVRASIIGAINERLDGSGYPNGLRGEQLDSLARMAAVVDEIDALGRHRADRKARSASHIYRHLLGCAERFDPLWVQRYVKHFGLVPIGSLVRFATGQLAWVQRLDRQGNPREVQLTNSAILPGKDMGEVLRDGEMARLGKLEAVVVPVERPVWRS